MKKFLLTLFAAAVSVTAFSAEITLKKKVLDRKTHKLYRYDIQGMKHKQAFNYFAFNKKDGKISLANNQGNACGLTYGWFGSGMIAVVINNKIQLMEQSHKIEEGKDFVKFNMEGQGFKGEVTFKFIAGSDVVKGYVKVEPAAAVKKLSLNLFSMPGHNGHSVEGRKPFKRQFATALRRAPLEKGKNIILDQNKENWIAFFDEYNDGTGTGVLLFAPEKVKSVKAVSLGSLAAAYIELPAAQNEFDFILRGIPTFYLDEDEVIDDMKKNAAQIQKL